MHRKAVCALAVLLLTTAARADWEGTARTKIDPPPKTGAGTQEARIRGKGSKVRIDVNGRMGKGAVVVDGKARTMTLILEERQAFRMTDTDAAAGFPGGYGAQPAVVCEGDAPKACLEAAGFKQGGGERVNGQKATKWSRDRATSRGLAHQELWVAESFKEFVVVRQRTKVAERTVTLDVEGLKRAPQPEALFQVPEGYREMGNWRKRARPGQFGRPAALPVEEQ